MSQVKTVLITGGNAGIGLATARQLAAQGHRLVLACRDVKKAEQARQGILALTPQADIRVYALDLGSFASIRAFAGKFLAEFSSFDVLINNAGAYPLQQQFTQDGFELQFGVNYLGHFLLTHLLLPGLKASPQARIVHVSSIMHNVGKIDFESFRGRKRYRSGMAAYGQSKLANLIFSNELSRRLPSTITSNAVHPGGVDSDIYRDLPRLAYRFMKMFLISPDRAGRYIADMAVGEKYKGKTGLFKSAHGPLPVARSSKDRTLAKRLYDASVELTGVAPLP